MAVPKFGPLTGPPGVGPGAGPGNGNVPSGLDRELSPEDQERLEDLALALEGLEEAGIRIEPDDPRLNNPAFRAWLFGEDDVSEVARKLRGRDGVRGTDDDYEFRGPGRLEAPTPLQMVQNSTTQYEGNPEGLQAALTSMKNLEGRLSAAKADAEMQALAEMFKAARDPGYTSQAGKYLAQANQLDAELTSLAGELSKLENEAATSALMPQPDASTPPPPGHAGGHPGRGNGRGGPPGGDD